MAELLRVKERKIYELAQEGALPCLRLTGKLLFPRDALETLLAASGDAPRAAPDVLAGSHDPLLEWAVRASGSGLAMRLDGSLDGLTRLASGEAAAAGLHVRDADGGWNQTAAREALGTAPVVLVRWARRRFGLLLRPETTHKARSLADAADLRFAGRQTGAGGEIIFAQLCAEAGISPTVSVVARTETEAAAAVAEGSADAALGLACMARTFGLDFLPLAEDRFDIVVDRRAWFERPWGALWRFAQSPECRARAGAMGGYDLSELGRVIWNGP